ncbi:MAG: T9SS C-terminal target domain-containing protein [Sphingobacteriales bacterium]|nr:MAG: T9SS C-terminal target domain-containing protein [Sphingobacteriales bacterium]
MQKKILFVLAMLCLVVNSFGQPVPGLVAYWPMNGDFTDAGPNNLSVTNTAVTGTTNVAGVANRAMYFANPTSTVANYATVTANAAINFTGDFSISFAFYLSTTYAHPKGFFDNGLNGASGGGFGYGMWSWNANGYNSLCFNFRNGNLQTTAAGNIQLGVWTHAVFVRQAGVLKIYINGVLNNSGPEGTGTISYTGVPPRIGTMNYIFQTPQQYNGLNGSMDELRAYNRAVTNAEAVLLYNAWLSSQSLPVHLTSFNALLVNNTPVLYWKTSFEQNSSYFAVQRSYDGTIFETIGTITAKGNSSIETSYNYTDNAVNPSINNTSIFYRLQQYDADGKNELSNTVAVKYTNTQPSTFAILQNPVQGLLQLQGWLTATQQVALQITDAQGRMMQQQKLQLNQGRSTTTLPVTQLASGLYHITVLTTTGKQTLSFIKK